MIIVASYFVTDFWKTLITLTAVFIIIFVLNTINNKLLLYANSQLVMFIIII